MGINYTTSEGYIPFRGYKTWYRTIGDRDDPDKAPLLCLHGGPGYPSDSLEPLEALASSGRQVVFYDQLGGGKSDKPPSPAIYSIDLFVDEVGVIRRALGLERVHILGHSWGGMLAMEYALTQPEGLMSLILADTGPSTPQWVAETNRLLQQLSPAAQQAIQKHESEGTTEAKEYQDATKEFSRKFLGGRIDPRPDCLIRANKGFGSEVYNAMWGPSEWCATGIIKDWDVRHRLEEIRVPTLVVGGRYDEATPVITEALHHGISGSEWVIFDKSGHFPHLEETERYLQVLSDFLSRVEKK